MAGWGNWIANVATSAVGEVTQFGQDVLDSVTTVEDEEEGVTSPQEGEAVASSGGGGEEEEEESPTAPPSSLESTRKPVHVDPTTEAPAVTAISQKPKAAPSGKLRKKGLGAKLVSTPTSKTPTDTSPPAPAAAAQEEEPPKKEAVEKKQETPTAADESTPLDTDAHDGWGISLGMNLVSKGADFALHLLPDLDSPEQSPQRPTGAAAATATTSESTAVKAVVDQASQEIDPLDLLRSCRGQVELERREKEEIAGEDAVEKPAIELVAIVEELLNPWKVADFEYEEEKREPVQWVEDCSVGRRIRTTRLMITELKDEDGNPIAPEAVVDMMSEFPATAKTCANAIADIVIEELADVYAKKITKGCDWFTHSQATATSPTENVRVFSQNTKDLITYAQCEMAEGVKSLSELVQQCFMWAKKAEGVDLKKIKNAGFAINGECFVSILDAVTSLEEALECVQVLFPYPTLLSVKSAAEEVSPVPPRATDVDGKTTPKAAEKKEKGEPSADRTSVGSTPEQMLSPSRRGDSMVEVSPHMPPVPPPTPSREGTSQLIPLPTDNTGSSSPSGKQSEASSLASSSMSSSPMRPPVPPPTPARGVDVFQERVPPSPMMSSANDTPASGATPREPSPVSASPEEEVKKQEEEASPETAVAPTTGKATPLAEEAVAEEEPVAVVVATTTPEQEKEEEKEEEVEVVDASSAPTAPTDSPASEVLSAPDAEDDGGGNKGKKGGGGGRRGRNKGKKK